LRIRILKPICTDIETRYKKAVADYVTYLHLINEDELELSGTKSFIYSVLVGIAKKNFSRGEARKKRDRQSLYTGLTIYNWGFRGC
jgi:hypothetical protein